MDTLPPLPGMLDVSLECYRVLVEARIGVVFGIPRAMSEFGRQYMTYCDEGHSQEEARYKVLRLFRGWAEHRRRAVPVNEHGGEMLLDCEDRTAPYMVVFRTPVMIESWRETAPGTGPEFDKPDEYTGKIRHKYRVRLHLMTMADVWPMFHQIAFSHEPGKRYG